MDMWQLYTTSDPDYPRFLKAVADRTVEMRNAMFEAAKNA